MVGVVGLETKKLTTMKRSIALLIILSAIACIARQPEKGYRGFTDIGTSTRSVKFLTTPTASYSEMQSYVGFSTTHGYQFNQNIFLGGGLNVEYNINDDMWLAPLYLDMRIDLCFGVFTPFIDARLGYNLTEGSGLYFSPTVGYRFNWDRKVAINLGVGISLYNYQYIFYDASIDMNGNVSQFSGEARSNKVYFSARLGLEF